MSESDDNSDSEVQTGGGRASVESVSELFKEFKSARMSFEPLDTWLFVKARGDSSNDVESIQDASNISASSESDGSIVYQFDSEEVSTDDDDDDDDDVNVMSGNGSSIYVVDDYNKKYDKENTLMVKCLENSHVRSGCGIKLLSKADQDDVAEEDDSTYSDALLDYRFSLRSSVESIQKCITDSQQPAVSSVFTVKSESTHCSCNISEVCNDRELLTVHHESIRNRTNKCYRDSYSACDILDKFKSSPEKSGNLAVNISRANHAAVSVASPLEAVCTDTSAEWNSSDVDSTANISDTLKRMKKRQQIAQELLYTETTYQRHLELIVQVKNPFSMFFPVLKYMFPSASAYRVSQQNRLQNRKCSMATDPYAVECCSTQHQT